MKIPLRMPRVAAPGCSIVVSSVLAVEGSSVRSGDRLLDLQIGSMAATFHSQIAGIVVDQRAAAGDELLPGRIVLWIESEEPPPLGETTPPPIPRTGDGIVFRMPRELVQSVTPVVQSVIA